ncbi:MAG: hypothetical protein H0V73_05605 [Chloroflexi bacterium]|nr:hypothetical protein [Chloroflexota bacterium]
MTFLAGIFGVIGRFAGKLLTTTLGWASSLLFGRVPQNRQIVLALLTFGSVVWATLVIGVLMPDVGTFLVAAVPAPDVVDRGWIRLAMLAGVVVVPVIVGVATLFVVDPADRPRGRAALGAIVRGYPLCMALAVTLVILAGVGIARFVHHRALGWTDAHVPIVVRPGGYERVVADLERALDDAGLPVDRRPAPLPLAVPGRLLGRIAGPAIRALVPDRPVELVAPGLEIGLYPSDIAIGGKKALVARARATIATRLTSTAASMTTSAEAQEIERKLERLSATRIAGAGPRAARGVDLATAATTLSAIDDDLATADIAHDEWEILYRQRLQVERDLLAGRAPGSVLPNSGGTPLFDLTDGTIDADGRRGRETRIVSTVIAAAGFLLAGANVVVALLDRGRGRR